jgi:LCP family protein required for cell wall assembly
VAGWLSAAMTLLLVAASLAVYARYRGIWNSIHRVAITGLGPQPQSTGALNILLIGSDSRAGAKRRFGSGIQGQRSDTIMILHITPGHQRATALSIPRDSIVPYLPCGAEPGFAGQQSGPGEERINATFANGGPGCLWKTVEHETGIHIDHFIQLSFTGFEHIINDIGGVNICLPEAINDPASGLRLTAGLHHVRGAQALAFWRERHIGTGSDLQRIRRDQYLMAALLQAAARSDILGSPTRLYSIVVDAATAMTTDTGLDLRTMLSIAGSLRGLSSRSVQFVQVPEVPYPPDPQAEVMFEQPQAGALFAAIAHDAAPPGPARGERSRAGPRRPPARAPASPAPSTSAPSTSAPSTSAPSPSAPDSSAQAKSSPVSGLSRTYGGIQGSARACGDKAAFAGGDVPGDFRGG